MLSDICTRGRGGSQNRLFFEQIPYGEKEDIETGYTGEGKGPSPPLPPQLETLHSSSPSGEDEFYLGSLTFLSLSYLKERYREQVEELEGTHFDVAVDYRGSNDKTVWSYEPSTRLMHKRDALQGFHVGTFSFDHFLDAYRSQ